MANKLKHLIAAYGQIKLHSQDYVLATIIETFGSTYQKAGARMLINPAGEMIGILGGGCFEGDLLEHARTVFKTGVAKTVFYDMRPADELVWGLGLGCKGAVRILLQLVQANTGFSPLDIFAEIDASNASGVLVSIYESQHPQFPIGKNLLLPLPKSSDEHVLPTTAHPFTTSALQTALQQKARIDSHIIDGQAIHVFYDPLQASSRLLVFGAGADAIPLSQCAKLLGWQVTIVDHRPAYCNNERFPQADQVLNILPEELATTLELNPFNAVILMTHNLEYDQRYLQALVDCHIPFIGLLGPSHRKDTLMQALGNEAAQLSPRVFGPVGLDIGAETPEEIVLSIMAGIYAELNGRSGRAL